MSHVFACPHCGKRLRASRALFGGRVDCPRCSNEIAVPDQSPPPIPKPALRRREPERHPDDVYCGACREWVDPCQVRITPTHAWAAMAGCGVLSMLFCAGGAFVLAPLFLLGLVFAIMAFCFLFQTQVICVCPYCRMRIGERW